MTRFQILKGIQPSFIKDPLSPSIFEMTGKKVYFDFPGETHEGLLLNVSELISIAGKFKKATIEVNASFPFNKLQGSLIHFRLHGVTAIVEMNITEIANTINYRVIENVPCPMLQFHGIIRDFIIVP
jgi:hypothetical protein